MRSLLSITLTILCLAAASCSKVEIEEYAPTRTDAGQTTKTDEGNGYAFVRIGVYESIKDHSVTLTRVWVESDNSSYELPQFGSFFTSSAVSSDSSAPVFDTAEGDFHMANPTVGLAAVRVHFDAVVTSEFADYSIEIEDAVYTIDPRKAIWKSGGTYTYVIELSAELLGLHEVSFIATVADYDGVEVDF